MANLGFDRYTTDKLVRAGVAARKLPAVAEAFSAGELSLAADPAAALRADALVALCTAGHGGGSAPSPAQLVVHVDLGVLTGETPEGRCHILDGPALSAAAARRLGCDATMVTLLERDGQVGGGGPERPGVTLRMRRAVQGRDGTCRYPGCAIPATRTDAHHIHHWIDGGPTRLWNLLSLCEYHHNRHHDGEYDIRRTARGDLCFETHDGLLVGTAAGGCWKRPRRRAGPS